METLLIDTWVTEDCTVGRLSYADFRCLTLELPWEDNAQNISCIPEGEYLAIQYYSPKHGDVILLKDVPNRTMIEIHPGNYTRQIQGCILVGDSIKYLDGDDILDVTNSRNTMNKIMTILPEEFIVKITRSMRPN